nr:unnamed protein product [Callosobruchus analis]
MSVNDLNSIYKPDIKIIVCGDFKIDSYNRNPDNNLFNDVLSEFNLTTQIFWPTRMGKMALSIID